MRRILLHGCARAECEKCNHSELIAFSCKRRNLCPSCDAKRALIFGEHLHENVLLPYEHSHHSLSQSGSVHLLQDIKNVRKSPRGTTHAPRKIF
ncbi:hypothetical protein EBR25_12965 [bacterium]|nr:hypothetical protein [bacterium]